MQILLPILFGFHVILCVLIVLVVLMQRPKNEGLGAAFGGGVTENIFGAQTTHVLAKFTTWLAAGFFAMTLLLSMITAKSASSKTQVQEMLMNAPQPIAAPSPDAVSPTAPVPLATPDAAAEPVAEPSPQASPAN